MDGIPDSWREQHFGTNFLANLQALATADPDGDGANNYQEFVGGTNPLDPVSVRKVPLSVSTFAGSIAGGQDGFRTAATFSSPGTLTFDPSGRIWVCELTINDYVTPVPGAHRIRIIDAVGNVTTYGGSAEFGTVDGPLAVARFAGPTALDFDKAGDVLVLERSNHRIRRIDTNGIVSTLAGSTPGYQDGTGSDAKFNMPMGMCIDKEDNLFVADFGNACVRKVTSQGVVSTYAGGSRGYSDGDRSVARFDTPSDISIGPEGTLYVADWVSGLVRKIDTNGVVSTFASGLPYIERVFADAQGNVYTSVGSDGSYRKFRSDGSLDWSIHNPSGFQDGPISAARFGHFGETLVLPDGNLLISDGQNNRLRMITLQIPPLLTISPSASLFTNVITVSLSTAVTNGVLRYTLDGSEPTTAAPAYAGSFTLNATATVKARVFVNSNPVSDVWTQPFARVYALDDGIPASWREQYFGTNFLTNQQALATADPDGDGANNYQEFVGRTDPLNSDSVKKAPLSVSTFAGSVAGGQDGFRAQATFNVPTGVAFDATGNVWIPEAGNRIRRMDINGMVTTVTGDGVAGSQDGEGTVARFNYPNHIAFDTSGNAYVIEFYGHRIRKIDLGGNVTTFAGSTVGFQEGTGTAARFNGPQSIATGPDGYLYVADTGNHRIRKVSLAGAVTTYAGGTAGLQDGDRALAQFSTPVWATVDGQGNVYVADWGNARIRKIGTNGVVSTVASGLSYVEIIHLDGRGGFYVTCGGPPYQIMRFDQNWQVDWKVEYPSGFQDGTMEQARFSKSVAGFLHLSATELLVSDVFNHRLRLITLGVPPLLTVSPAIPLFTNVINVSLSTTVTNGVLRYTLDGSEPTTTAPAYAGSFTLNAATTIKARVFMNDNPVSDVLTQTFARAYALDDGIPASWREQHFGTNFLANPQALATADPDGDGANNYQEFLSGTDPLNSNSLKRLPISVSTYAGSIAGGQDGFRTLATFLTPDSGLAFDAAGNLWIPESFGHRIRKMDVNGVVTTVAGDGVAGWQDGIGTAARFNTPNQVAFDTLGNAYVNEVLGHRVRKIDLLGNVTTLAGSTAGYQDGVGVTALFNTPQSIGVGPDGNLYVADTGNHRIRKVTPAGEVTTYAGSGAGFQDGDCTVARFDRPAWLDVDSQGAVYVADWGNAKIRKINFAGVVGTVASGLSYVEVIRLDGTNGFHVARGGPPYRIMRFDRNWQLEWKAEYPAGLQDGQFSQAQFNEHAGGFLYLSQSELLVSDPFNHRLRLITLGVPPLLTVSPAIPLFTNSITVSLSTTVTNGVLRYTLDGSEPTTTAPAYIGSFTLTAAATAKARVFVNNIPLSDVLTQAFARVYALNDGIPASWREQYFGAGYLTDLRVAWDADPDGDGANNLQEYVAGTDPLEPLSGFRVGIRMAPVITWNSISNRIYRILKKDTLSATNWSVVVPSVLATNSVSTFIDVNASSPYGFYVIEVLP